MNIPPRYRGFKWDADRQKLVVVFEGTALFDIDQLVPSVLVDENSLAVANIYTEGSDLIVVSDE